MKLSFVIPAHNEALYMRQCLRSVVNEAQTGMVETEIIVVNNASTDDTAAVARSFTGVKVVDEPRKGLLFARQAGFRAATGDYIAQIDADCELVPGWLPSVLRELEQHPQAVAVSGPVIYRDLPLRQNLLVRGFYYLAYIMYVLNRFILRSGSVLQGGNAVIRRSALENIGGYNTAIQFYGEDTDLAGRLSKVGPVIFTFKVFLYTSGRRLEAEGMWKMATKYFANFLWLTFLRRPFHDDYTDARPAVMTRKTPATDIKKLNTALLWARLGLAIVFAFALFEHGLIFSKFIHPEIAEAKETDAVVVAKLHPRMERAETRIHNFDYDGDGHGKSRWQRST